MLGTYHRQQCAAVRAALFGQDSFFTSECMSESSAARATWQKKYKDVMEVKTR